jgi:hypothetical protein
LLLCASTENAALADLRLSIPPKKRHRKVDKQSAFSGEDAGSRQDPSKPPEASAIRKGPLTCERKAA